MIRHRYRRITLFFARLLLGLTIWEIILPKIGLKNWSTRTRTQRLKKAAQAYRSLAVTLGGVLIKVGQFLSSRVDVLPREFTDELLDLQDEVQPETFADIRKVAEAEYGMPLEEKFAWVDPHPLASASLGQVHRARLVVGINHTSENLNQVVLKVQRPGIETIISTDLAALQTVGRWVQRYRPISRRANVPELLNEFTAILLQEIDYIAEGHNAEKFAANFAGDPHIRVPRVIWSHTTKRALVLEDVFAIKITDYSEIESAGIDRKAVANRLLDTYLKQIFEDGFFHADPHPGNLFVSPLEVIQPGSTPSGTVHSRLSTPWQLTFVDFGMVGHLPANTKAGLRELLIGVGTQDSERVVTAYQTLGVLLPEADLELLRKAEARAFEEFWGKSMTELTQVNLSQIQKFTDEFRELIYSMPFQVPQDFIFLARCVGILSGICTGLDREFNVWEHLAPYARKLIADEARTGSAQWLEEALRLLRLMLTIPLKMDTMLVKMERGEIAVRSPEISQNMARIEARLRQITSAILFAALLLAGIQLILGGYALSGQVLLIFAGLNLLAVLWLNRNR